MPIYIQAASTISNQNTYACKGFSVELLRSYKFNKLLIEPDYKPLIDGSLVRRISKMNKVAMACMIDCLGQYPVDVFDGMIVGTGLGCVEETEKFLKVVEHGENQNIISPVSFIQSGHNAVSGQLALIKKNLHYNMTHVQGGVSFENALLDTFMFIIEGNKHVLLGGIDENTPLIEKLAVELSLDKEVVNHLTSGCTFFIISGEKEFASTSIVAIRITNDWKYELEQMLNDYGVENEEIDRAFVGFNFEKSFVLDISIPQTIYTNICGRYWSSSAFGVHLATDFLNSNVETRYAVVINFAEFGQVGLTLLKRE